MKQKEFVNHWEIDKTNWLSDLYSNINDIQDDNLIDSVEQ